MKVIPRQNIVPLTQIESNGKSYSLGDYRSINEHDSVKTDFSFSWVGLNSEQILNPHWHTIDSYIYVYEGHGKSSGSSSAKIKSGDWIYIPAGCMHGFLPEKNGFKAISFQPNPTNFFNQNNQTQFVKAPGSNDSLVNVSDNFSELMKISQQKRPLLLQKKNCDFEATLLLKKTAILFVFEGQLKINSDQLGTESSAFLEKGEIVIKTLKPTSFILFEDI